MYILIETIKKISMFKCFQKHTYTYSLCLIYSVYSYLVLFISINALILLISCTKLNKYTYM